MSEVFKGGEVLTPDSVQQVADMVREAAGKNHKVSTSRWLDAADTDVSRIELSHMKSVVDYPARDMTITVQAGMPVAELSAILAQENQQLPLDTAAPDVTVGALVAGNFAGPRQFGYGTARDYLIGMEAVDGQGRVFHAGGRVVKNVAGYDLCRLMVGSRGALGILTQLTFKLKPTPESTSALVLNCDSFAVAQDNLNRLNTTAATPVVLDLVAAAGQTSVQLILVVEGAAETCNWQIQQLRNDCTAFSELPFSEVAASVQEFCQSSKHTWPQTAVRIQTLPSKVITMVEAAVQQGLNIHAHAGNGLLYVTSSDSDELPEVFCQQLVRQHSGNATVWQSDHPLNATDSLTVKLRQAFDPHSVFSK